jgi:hypothetical protein
MPIPHPTNVIPSYNGYPWKDEIATSSSLDPSVQGDKAKRRKRRNNPNDPYQAPTATPPFPPQGQGVGRATGPEATNPNTYNNAIGNVTLTAPSGSEAARFPGGTANPFAIPMAANDPNLVANDMMSARFGLPAGSATATELAKNFNPYDKIYGLGIRTPTSDVDWVNLGASLMGDAGGPLSQLTGGAQLDPKSLMTNMVSSIVSEVNNLKSGGSGAGDQYNPLAELANMNPQDAMNSFKGMVQGMLQGTMPDQEITGYINFLDRIGQQFVMQFMHSNSAQGQADGASFITFLVQQLGPSLGL